MFRNAKDGPWYTRVKAPGQERARKVSLGTTLKTPAASVEAFLKMLVQKLEYADLLAAITEVPQRLTAADAYALGVDGARAMLAARAAEAARVELEPLVVQWQKERTKVDGSPVRAAQYARSVRALLPAGATTDALEPRAIRSWLLARDVRGSTRNRDKAALSSFCAWLVEQGMLDDNPVRRVAGWSEESRVTWLRMEQAQALVHAHADPDARLAACLAIGWGWEWDACRNGLVRDLDLDKGLAFARGGKNPWRSRMCVLTECMAWVRPIVRELVADRLPSAPLIQRIDEHANIRLHHAACRLAGLPHCTFHDQRHTHAILLTMAGELPQNIWSNLGHRDGTLYYKCYARYGVQPEHFRTAVARHESVTAPELSRLSIA